MQFVQQLSIQDPPPSLEVQFPPLLAAQAAYKEVNIVEKML